MEEAQLRRGEAGGVGGKINFFWTWEHSANSVTLSTVM